MAGIKSMSPPPFLPNIDLCNGSHWAMNKKKKKSHTKWVYRFLGFCFWRPEPGSLNHLRQVYFRQDICIMWFCPRWSESGQFSSLSAERPSLNIRLGRSAPVLRLVLALYSSLTTATRGCPCAWPQLPAREMDSEEKKEVLRRPPPATQR